MIEKLDDDRLQELSEEINLKYLRSKGQNPLDILCSDIEGILSDVFQKKIVYEIFAEKDPGRDGFTSNGTTPLRIKRNGKIKDQVFPADTIVLDSYLKRSENSIAKRFVLAHELGHIIYEIVSPGQAQSSFHSEFDVEMDYTPDQLHSIFNLEEIQATRIGCAVIMPHFLLVNTLHRVMNAEKFPVFGIFQTMPADSKKLQMMADDLGVSAKMLRKELDCQKLIEHRPISEYMQLFGKGGEC